MSESVASLGGGVGGLSAAHELIERGFDVVVCAARALPGGKARSMPVPGSAVGERGGVEATGLLARALVARPVVGLLERLRG